MFVLTISRSSLNIGYDESKPRSLGQILGYSCLQSRGHICDSILMKLDQNVCLAISRPSVNMGHVGLTCRSPGLILQNSCLHSRGHICDRVFNKLDQNVCLDNI